MKERNIALPFYFVLSVFSMYLFLFFGKAAFHYFSFPVILISRFLFPSIILAGFYLVTSKNSNLKENILPILITSIFIFTSQFMVFKVLEETKIEYITLVMLLSPLLSSFTYTFLNKKKLLLPISVACLGLLLGAKIIKPFQALLYCSIAAICDFIAHTIYSSFSKGTNPIAFHLWTNIIGTVFGFIFLYFFWSPFYSIEAFKILQNFTSTYEIILTGILGFTFISFSDLFLSSSRKKTFGFMIYFSAVIISVLYTYFFQNSLPQPTFWITFFFVSFSWLLIVFHSKKKAQKI